MINCGGELSEWSELLIVIDSEYDIVVYLFKYDFCVYIFVGINKIIFIFGFMGLLKGVCLLIEL